MKSLGLIALLILSGCGKPVDPTKSDNPVYGSVSAVISGVETSCENCLIIENKGTALRVTFSENGVEECSGQGTLSYLSNNPLLLPEEVSQENSWDAVVVGDNASKDPFCFPDQLSLDIEKLDDNLYKLTYNGKVFNIRKLN